MQLPYNDQAMFTTQLEVLKKTISGTTAEEHLALQSVISGKEAYSDLTNEIVIACNKDITALLDADPTLSHVKFNQAAIDGEAYDAANVRIDNFVTPYPILLNNFFAESCNVTENLGDFDEHLAEIQAEPSLPKNLIFSKWGWPTTLRDIKTNEDLTDKYAEIIQQVGYIPNSDKILISTMLCDPKYQNLTIIWDDAFDRDWDYQGEDGSGMAFRNFGMGFANRTLKPGVKEAMSCSSTQ